MSTVSSRKRITSKSHVPTQWSEWEWDTTYATWRRYRLDKHEEYEYEYLPTSQGSIPSALLPGYNPGLDHSYGLGTLHIGSNNAHDYQEIVDPVPRSHSEPAYQTEKMPPPTLGIFLYDQWGQEIRYTANLDSLASEDWISDRVANALQHPVRPTDHRSKAAGGRVVSSKGIVNLRWRKAPSGGTTYQDEFHILAGSDIDIIFSWTTCQKYNLLADTSSYLHPLVAHNPETEDEKRQREAEEAIQEQEQRDSEARKQRNDARRGDKRSSKPNSDHRKTSSGY